MSVLKNFLRDPRFFIPFGLLILLEIFLQSGLYSFLLQPRSYADNVSRIIRKAGDSKLNPEILILGTSVAYQGINVRRLNELLKEQGLTAQNGACEGAKLMTQHMIYKMLRPKMPRLKTVVLVSEVSFPWAARYGMDWPNRSMIAQAPRNVSFPLMESYDTRLTLRDKIFFYVRMMTYQRDLRDFILDPLDRFKGIGRRFEEKPSDYVYENKETYGISVFSSDNLHTCINKANLALQSPGEIGLKKIKQCKERKDGKADGECLKYEECLAGEKGACVSDSHHSQAAAHTCWVGTQDPMAMPGGDQWNSLFFKRLKIFHDEIRKDGLNIITVFAPYSTLIEDFNADKRLDIWRRNLKNIYGEKPFHILDLRRSLDGPGNGDLYYDTIHLNKFGAEKFTGELARALLKPPFRKLLSPDKTSLETEPEPR